MMRFQRSKPGSVAEWLEIATKGLAHDAKAKVSAEIRAHFGEAVEEYLKTEMPRARAHAEALAGLGDPRAARSRLRRVHLTWNEQIYLRSCGSHRRLTAAGVVIAVLTGLMMIWEAPFSGVCYLVLTTYALSLTLVRWELFTRRLWITLAHVAMGVVYSVCAILAFVLRDQMSYMLIVYLLLIPVWPRFLNEHLRLRAKLRGKAAP